MSNRLNTDSNDMNSYAMATEIVSARVVAPHEKRPARWVEMVKSITVVKVAN